MKVQVEITGKDVDYAMENGERVVSASIKAILNVLSLALSAKKGKVE